MNKLDDDHQKEQPFLEASIPDDANAIDDEKYQYWMDKVTKFHLEILYAPAHIRKNRRFIMAAVEKNANALKYAAPEHQNDKEIVKAAVEQSGGALQYASPAVQNDKEVVKAAVKQDVGALRYASPSIQNDKEVVKVSVEKYGYALKYASEPLRSDKTIVMAAVQKSGGALEYATPELRNDKEVVKVAVEEDGRALEYASEPLRGDKEIVKLAVQQSGYALKFASEPLRGDKDIVKIAFEQQVSALQHASDEPLGDKEFILSCCLENPEAIKYASDGLRADRDVVLASVSLEPLLLKYALGGLNQDRDCLIAAGIWDEEIFPGDGRKQITLSTRFAQDPKSVSMATLFTLLFKENPYIKDTFSIYSPNAWAKSTCDVNWTDFDHPCRGTFDTCELTDDLKTGEAKPDSCWRYSFRQQLLKSKRENGFMLQVLEAAKGVPVFSYGSALNPALGKGQIIEKDMAEDLQVKVFRVSPPMYDHRGDAVTEIPFTEYEIGEVVTKIRQWYDEGCKDMSECDMNFHYYSGDEEDRRILELRKNSKTLKFYK